LDCITHVLDNVGKYLRADYVDYAAFKTSILYSDVSSILNQSDKNPFFPFTARTSLLTPLSLMASGVHRIPVFGDQNNLCGILSQSDYISFLATRKDAPELAFALQSTVEELGYQEALLTTSLQESVYNVLSLMKTNGMSAIPLVNTNGQLAGCFSASDLRLFPLSQWGLLFLEVEQFLRERHASSLVPVSIGVTSTFSDVVELMAKNKVHRVFVVDDQKKPVGVVSTTDVTRWLNLLLN